MYKFQAIPEKEWRDHEVGVIVGSPFNPPVNVHRAISRLTIIDRAALTLMFGALYVFTTLSNSNADKDPPVSDGHEKSSTANASIPDICIIIGGLGRPSH